MPDNATGPPELGGLVMTPPQKALRSSRRYSRFGGASMPRLLLLQSHIQRGDSVLTDFFCLVCSSLS